MRNACETEEADETGELKVCVVENKTEGNRSQKINSFITYLENKNTMFFHAFAYLVKDFNDSIRNKEIVKWCTWWALSLCGYLQVSFKIFNY